MTDYYTFESSFESGDFTEWGSEVDTQSKLSVDHFKLITEQLGKYPEALPYKGAYAAHIDLSLGTADAYVQDTATLVFPLATTVWFRFYFQATRDLLMAASDYFTIFAVQSAGPVDEAVIGVVRTAGGVYQLVAAETSTLAAAQGATTRSADLIRDAWHCLELGLLIDSGPNDGTIAFFLDGYQVGSTITAVDQAAITQARLGATGIDAGTTAGHLLYDSFVTHTARLGPFMERYPQFVELTKSGFVAVGPGRVMEYALVPGGAVDNHLNIYDSDRLPVLAGYDRSGPELANSAPYEVKVYAHSKQDGFFNQGCYVQLSGTAPRATVTLGEALVSTGAIRQYATMRKP